VQTTGIQPYKRTYHVQDVDWFSVVLQLVSLKNLQVINSSFSPFSFKQLPGLIIHKLVGHDEKETLKTIWYYIFSCKNICRIVESPSDLELGALTKWLASRCLSECLGRLLYIAPSSTALVRHLGVEKRRRASESACAKLRALRSQTDWHHRVIMSGSPL
jgi:hypothetical protein